MRLSRLASAILAASEKQPVARLSRLAAAILVTREPGGLTFTHVSRLYSAALVSTAPPSQAGVIARLSSFALVSAAPPVPMRMSRLSAGALTSDQVPDEYRAAHLVGQVYGHVVLDVGLKSTPSDILSATNVAAMQARVAVNRVVLPPIGIVSSTTIGPVQAQAAVSAILAAPIDVASTISAVQIYAQTLVEAAAQSPGDVTSEIMIGRAAARALLLAPTPEININASPITVGGVQGRAMVEVASDGFPGAPVQVSGLSRQVATRASYPDPRQPQSNVVVSQVVRQIARPAGDWIYSRPRRQPQVVVTIAVA